MRGMGLGVGWSGLVMAVGINQPQGHPEAVMTS